MKKGILLVTALLLSVLCQAQSTDGRPAQADSVQYLFGYLSYERALQSMPDYEPVQQGLITLRAQYNAELRRAEEDFNKKYEEFLEGRADFPPTILRKRQMELQELMDRNVAFREQSKRELADAEEKAMAPLKARLNQVIAGIARLNGFAFVLNTDANATPYINPDLGADINALVAEQWSPAQ